MLILFILALVQSRLIAVVEICRHGARAPTTFMPWDNYNTWPQGPGELIPEGMRQHYLLGAELRNRYIIQEQLLVPDYFQPNIYVFSSDYNRTIMSAQSQIQGLFPYGTGPVLRNNISATNSIPPINVTSEENIISQLGLNALPNLTQVIPIHSDDSVRQYALNPSSACNYYNDLADYKMTLPELQEIYNEYEDVITTISQVMSISIPQAQKLSRDRSLKRL